MDISKFCDLMMNAQQYPFSLYNEEKEEILSFLKNISVGDFEKIEEEIWYCIVYIKRHTARKQLLANIVYFLYPDGCTSPYIMQRIGITKKDIDEYKSFIADCVKAVIHKTNKPLFYQHLDRCIAFDLFDVVNAVLSRFSTNYLVVDSDEDNVFSTILFTTFTSNNEMFAMILDHGFTIDNVNTKMKFQDEREALEYFLELGGGRCEKEKCDMYYQRYKTYMEEIGSYKIKEPAF